jgi:hypothetical protein
VYDVHGRAVGAPIEMDASAGDHSVPWPPTAAEAARLPSGVYFARVATPAYTRTLKLLLAK